jgi:hypothetical protein
MRVRKRMPEGTRRFADGAAKSDVKSISRGSEDGGYPVIAELPRSDTSSWAEERAVRLWLYDILPRMARFAARRKLTAMEEELVERGTAFLAAKGLRPR